MIFDGFIVLSPIFDMINIHVLVSRGGGTSKPNISQFYKHWLYPGISTSISQTLYKIFFTNF